MVVRERFGKERRIKGKRMMQALYCSGSFYCFFVSTMYVHTYVRRSFRQTGGAVLVSRLAKSKQHPMKIVFAANKVCCKHTIIATLLYMYVVYWSSLGPPYPPALTALHPR